MIGGRRVRSNKGKRRGSYSPRSRTRSWAKFRGRKSYGKRSVKRTRKVRSNKGKRRTPYGKRTGITRSKRKFRGGSNTDTADAIEKKLEEIFEASSSSSAFNLQTNFNIDIYKKDLFYLLDKFPKNTNFNQDEENNAENESDPTNFETRWVVGQETKVRVYRGNGASYLNHLGRMFIDYVMDQDRTNANRIKTNIVEKMKTMVAGGFGVAWE